MTAVRQSWQVYLRGLRVLKRQPAYLGMTLFQPIIWLLLFGALFKSVTKIPGFHGTYINFLTPGVVVMLAVFSAGWTGMGFVEDINSGVMDRMLTSPVWRGALNAGTIAYGAFMVVIQTILIVLIALALGANFEGVAGVALLLVIAALLAAVVAALSNAIGILARQRETVIGAVTFVQLPLTFLSVALMQRSLLPSWIQSVASYNPVNWAAEAARSAAMQKIDWSLVASRIGFLAVLLMVAAYLATRAFAT